MAKTYLEPGKDYVLVVDTYKVQNINGIDLPDNIKQKDMLSGYIVSVGPRCECAKEKDTVMYGPYAGKLLAFNGVEFRVLKEDQIELWVRTIPDQVDLPDIPGRAPIMDLDV